MSYSTHDEASVAATKLLKRVDGKGWEIRVWENLGWHFELQNGPLQLYESDGRYSCLLGEEDPPTGGSLFWEVKKSYRSPGAAIIAQMREARKVLAERDKLVRALEKRLRQE